MITRCLLNQNAFRLLNRGICTSRPSSSIFQKIKSFLLAEDRDNFDAENIRNSHKKDKINEKEWTLIYRDIGASRTFWMTAAFLPCFIAGATVFAVDVNSNSPGNRFDFVQKLVTDAEELGALIGIPSVALVIVVAFLLRVQQIRIIRIYQNRKDVEQFLAIRSKGVVTQYKQPFRRDDATGFYFAESQTDGKRVLLHFLFGNIQIAHRKFMVMDDMFRANNYKSYMLNETRLPGVCFVSKSIRSTVGIRAKRHSFE